LNVNHFGFREKHSNMHATLVIKDKIQRAIEADLFSCMIFLDFLKAFDKKNKGADTRCNITRNIAHNLKIAPFVHP